MWVMVAAQNALVQNKITSEDFLKTPASKINIIYCIDGYLNFCCVVSAHLVVPTFH